MKAYVFDIDGVITDPQEKRITNPKLIFSLLEILKDKNVIAFLTGRALDWVDEKVLKPIEKTADSKRYLENIFVSGEFGNTKLIYDNGVKKAESLSAPLPQKLIDEVKLLLADYQNSMFLDPDKKTMLSVEVKRGYPLDKFHVDQKKLVHKLKKLIESNNNLEVTYNIIAIDIKEKTANKHLAVSHFLSFLKNRGIKADHFIAFGDNLSDLEIGRELTNSNFSVKFVYTGLNKNKLPKENFPIHITKSSFTAGTLEFLEI